MTSPAEQYTESLKKSQQAMIDALEAWSKSAQNSFGLSAAGSDGQKGSEQVIDQVFDFAEQMLSVQRQFAKNLSAIAASTQSRS